MKKVLLIAVIAMMAIAAVACGAPAAEDAGLVGTTWELESMIEPTSGMVITGDDLAALAGETTYEFKADGVLTTNNELSGAIDMEWSQEGSVVTITANGLSADYNLDGTTMVSTDGNEVTLVQM